MKNYDEFKFPPSVPKLLTNQTVVPQPKTLDNYQNEFKFLFETETIANWFSFNNNTVKIGINSGLVNDYDFTITSDDVFGPVVYNKSVVVELLNIELNSYDSLKKGRLNILDVVPDDSSNTNNQSNIISYEPNNVNFIKLNYINDVLQRTFRVRLLNKFLKPIKTTGLIVLTLLIKD